MSALEKAICTLNAYAGSRCDCRIAPGAQLIVTIVFLCVVLSVPMTDPGSLVWMYCYPIIMAEALGIGYAHVFVKSLWVLPLVVLIGVFNPWFDREPLWQIQGYVISRGWVSFASVVLRGMLSVQALLVVVESCGFLDMCRAMRKMHLPAVLVTQLMLLYHYLTVLLDEAQTMHRSRQARGYGRRSYPLSMWGTFAGQLLLRSVDRARRINRAMIARGFNGDLAVSTDMAPLAWTDYAYIAGWLAVFALLRFVDMSNLLINLTSAL